MTTPDQSMEQLLALAFHQGPAVEANLLISAVRRQVQQEAGQAVNYEVSLIGRDQHHLTRTIAPRLTLYLREKRLGPRSAAVFLSLFWEDTLYFVSAGDFFAHVQATMGLDDEAFGCVMEMWERTGRAAAGLLPPD